VKRLFRETLFGGYTPNSFAADLGFTVTRIGAGLMMAIGHGWGKIPPSEQFIGGVTAMGFPMPTASAWAAALSEFLGGILLALGLLTRPAAFFIAFTMLVAAFKVHWDDPFFAAHADREIGQGSKEMAILFLLLMIPFLFAGSGRMGVDRALR
jgi:putative oxidoreductase